MKAKLSMFFVVLLSAASSYGLSPDTIYKVRCLGDANQAIFSGYMKINSFEEVDNKGKMLLMGTQFERNALQMTLIKCDGDLYKGNLKEKGDIALRCSNAVIEEEQFLCGF